MAIGYAAPDGSLSFYPPDPEFGVNARISAGCQPLCEFRKAGV